MSKYIVADEHTLGCIIPGMPLWMSVLAADKDGHSPKNGSVSLFGATVRPATLEDFKKFRVQTPPEMLPQGPPASVEVFESYGMSGRHCEKSGSCREPDCLCKDLSRIYPDGIMRQGMGTIIVSRSKAFQTAKDMIAKHQVTHFQLGREFPLYRMNGNQATVLFFQRGGSRFHVWLSINIISLTH